MTTTNETDLAISKEMVLDNVIYEAVNSKAPLNPTIVQMEKNGMKICFRVLLSDILSDDSNEIKSFRMTRQLMREFQISDGELNSSAEKNTRAKMTIGKLDEMIGAPSTDLPVHVVSNDMYMWGAGTIMLNDIFQKLCEAQKVDYCYVIPSSIHELLVCYPSDGTPNQCELNSLIQEVNTTIVDSDDVLGDTSYIFHRNDGFEN